MRVLPEALLTEIVGSVRQLVTSTHHELETIPFATLTATHVDAACIADDLQIPTTGLTPARAVSVECMWILRGNALHAVT
jgi:hypothetical protein